MNAKLCPTGLCLAMRIALSAVPRALLDSTTKRQAPKSEILNPKAERRPKSETRRPKSLLSPLCWR